MSIVLHYADCFDVFPSIKDQSIDLILCDPPYGTTACKWDSILPLDKMWEELKRITKDNGAIVLFASQPFTSVLIASNLVDFKYTWTWNKIRASNHLNSKKQPLRVTEDIAIFYSEQCYYNPQLRDREKKNIRDPKKAYGKGNNQTYGKTKENFMFNEGREIPLEKGYPLNLIEISQTGSFGNKRFHPTQKPVELLEYLIKTYSLEGQTVLDFTMGSGSTGVACKNTNRSFIGIEKEIEYYNIAKQRILTESNNQVEIDPIESMFEEYNGKINS